MFLRSQFLRDEQECYQHCLISQTFVPFFQVDCQRTLNSLLLEPIQVSKDSWVLLFTQTICGVAAEQGFE